MKKITFITLHLGYGGVENALTTLSNSLTSNYEVEIVSVYKRTDSPVFKLNKNIKLTYFKIVLIFNVNYIDNYVKLFDFEIRYC